MQAIPVDVGQLGLVLCAVAPAVKVDRETGKPRTDAEGRQVWTVGLMVTQADGQRASVISVSVPGEPVGLVAGQPVEVAGLVAQQWEMNGRRGLSFRADAITAPGGGGKGR
nr:hypothetical protein [Streptomyces sp. YIM 98790]